jgi:hypothetical protein
VRYGDLVFALEPLFVTRAHGSLHGTPMRQILPIVLLLALGCGSGGGGNKASSAAPAAPSAGQQPVTAPTGPSAAASATWLKGDLHVHTHHSGDGFDTVAQTLGLARIKGLDWIALTDHDTLSHAADPDAVPSADLGLAIGCEWTDVAHGGAIGIRTVPPKIDPAAPVATWTPTAQAHIGQAHAEGGAFILYHPTWALFPWILPVQDFDAIEIWNSFWTVGDIGLHPTTQARLRERLDQKGFTAAGIAPSPEIAATAGRPGSANDQALFYWEEFLNQGRQVAAVGGSDRHRFFMPGYPTTWVLAPDASQASIVAALRAGRTIVTSGPAGPRVTFEGDVDGDGVFERTIGDTIPAGIGTTLRVRVEGAHGGLLRIVKRRQVIVERRIDSDPFDLVTTDVGGSGDWYRVDVLQRNDWTLPGAGNVLTFATGGGAAGGTSAVYTVHRAGGGAAGGTSAVYTIVSMFGVAIGMANQPVLDFDEKYLRLLSVDITGGAAGLEWSRAAVTSAMFVR